MLIDKITKQAISHTLHCLFGCSLGEILGMAGGAFWQWNNFLTTIISILLAFFFGYLLTTLSLKRKGDMTTYQAIKTALATDTVSIISMEAIDNVFIWLVPGALDAYITSGLFWFSLFASLIVAFILTVPVNRWFLIRGETDHLGHM